jgi:hypothetical protein
MKMLLPCLTGLLGAVFAQAAHGAMPVADRMPASVVERRLVLEKDSALVWTPTVGRAVRVNDPQLTLVDPRDNAKLPFSVKPRNRSVRNGQAVLGYALSLDQKGFRFSGTGTLRLSLSPDPQKNALVAQMELAFREAVTGDVETVYAFIVQGEPARQMGLPERNGYFKVWPLLPGVGGAGRFDLGNAGKGPMPCSELGVPAVGLIFGDQGAGGANSGGGLQPWQLAVAADPYCGGYIEARAVAEGNTPATRIVVRTTYTGSVIPIRSERRTLTLEFHRQGNDGTVRSFYRTIPGIEPGARWTQGIHLVYYDYLSEKGEGWFKDLQVLAERIPRAHRSRVAVCLHGWYDYFQQYAYDHKSRQLLKEWTAFPGTYKVPMSLAEMHRRLKFAKDLGFRVLLYFSDGTNSDSGAPGFHTEYVLKDKSGKSFPGWKGPDSLGQPLMMDPSVPGLRDWYRGYLKALLDEYAKDVDGFVWDETFYIKPDFISYTRPEPAYADRAMMSLVSELTQMVQTYHDRNPDLVFLASDLGETSYALVAHGTYQDSAMRESAWGPSMFANYRNCLWSCNWFPLHHAKENEIASEKYGLPQGVSNGWEDNCGPSRMPAALLDAVLERFTRNVESNRERLRYLTP